jgi:hypothetical protein
MKYNSVFLLVFLLISCDRYGNVSFISGYEHDVIAHRFFDYNGVIFERTSVFSPGYQYLTTGRHRKYENIVAIRIETQEGTVLAEYLPEYLLYLRKIYGIKKKQIERWVLTEKGLFLLTKKIRRHYAQDLKKIIEYYRSDEAVQDFQAMLEAGK